jgi:ubiquinone/menaquinone biosynthesis C-methylase UbiE
VHEPGGVWADLGAGSGAFTLALAELIGPQGIIYAVDKDARALRQAEQTMHLSFPDNTVYFVTTDFTRPLDLPALDGMVMANSLHFHNSKEALLEKLRGFLKPGARFILVEYNADRGNPWVPYPLSYPSWEKLAQRCGFSWTRLLATHPSRFLNEIYSAVSW